MSIVRPFAAFVVLVACLAPARPAAAQGQPVMSLEGDGLKVRVLELNEETGVARGELQLGQTTYAFAGKMRESSETTIVEGTFKAGNDSFPFTSKQEGDSDVVTFETGGTTYRLKVRAAGDENMKKDDRRPPVGRDGQPQRADVLRLKRQAFPDVSMGNAPAYTMLVPEGWSAKGQIEWHDIFDVYHPQAKIQVASPEGGRIEYIWPSYIRYFENHGVPQGGLTPPPKDFPRWFAETLAKARPNVTDLKLVGSKRDEQGEAAEVARARATGGMQGVTWEYHQMTFEYEEAGQRRREEVLVKYMRFPNLMPAGPIRSYYWGMFPQWFVSAPADRFDAMKGMLFAIANTTVETPQWFTAKQQILAENARKRNAAIWEQIRRRGEQIKNMHVSQPERQAYTDSVTKDPQRERINSIYETHDRTDTDGSVVNLPIYYHHAFSDGKGNILLSNRISDRPGEHYVDINAPK